MKPVVLILRSILKSMIESIILGLLRTLGIILLSIIVVLLFLILIILFLPILYNININYDESFVTKGRFKILFGVVTACIDTECEEKLIVKVFGVPVKKIKFDKEGSDTENDLREEETLFKLSIDNKEYTAEQRNSADTSSVNQNSVRPKNPFKLIKEKITEFVYNIIKNIKNIISTIKNIRQKFDMIVSFLSDESSKTAFSESKGSLLKFLIHFFPKKSDMVLTFGLEDPAQVGYILACVSPFYGMYGNWLTIDPRFDEKIFKLKGNARGRIFTFYLLWHLLRVYFNRHVKTLRNKYKTSRV